MQVRKSQSQNAAVMPRLMMAGNRCLERPVEFIENPGIERGFRVTEIIEVSHHEARGRGGSRGSAGSGTD